MGYGLIWTERVYRPAAHWDGATAFGLFDHAASTDNPTPASLAGSNQLLATLDFTDSQTTYARLHHRLPTDWYPGGAIDVRLLWLTPATSGNAIWTLETAYRAEAGVGTLDPAFNTAATVTTAAPGTANRLTSSAFLALSKTGAPTTAPVECLLFLRIGRNPSAGGDTIANTARLVGLELTYQRLVTVGP